MPCGTTGLDLAASHQCIDITLGLRLVDAISRCDLAYEIVIAHKPAEIVLGELSPFRAYVASLGLAEIRKIDGRSLRTEDIHQVTAKKKL
jgi:hypothetical protein